MENKWIYFGIFLDKESKEKLTSLAFQVVDNSWRIYCHHMTIAFNDGSEEAQELYNFYKDVFGEKFELIATHIGVSDDAVAVKVIYSPGTKTNFPHITLATPQGGKPVNSNYIKEWKKLKTPIMLSGTFNSFNKG